MGQDDGIHFVVPEHLDILSLLLFVSDIVDNLFCGISFFRGMPFFHIFLRGILTVLTGIIGYHFGFYLLAVFVYGAAAFLCFFRLIRAVILLTVKRLHFQALRQSQILAVQVLEQDIVIHTLAELVVLQAAELDEGADIIPVFLVFFLLRLAHAGKLVRHLLGDIFGNLLHKAVILQRASGHIQRQVRAVDDTLQQHQEFRNDFLDIICNKYLVVIQLYSSLDGFILHVNLGEVQNSLQVKRIIHVQMNPEQRLLVIMEYLAVKFQILLFGTVVGVFRPQRRGLVEQLGTLLNLQLDRFRLLLFFIRSAFCVSLRGIGFLLRLVL